MGAWEGGVCYTVLRAYYMLSTISAHRAISSAQPGSGCFPCGNTSTGELLYCPVTREGASRGKKEWGVGWGMLLMGLHYCQGGA